MGPRRKAERGSEGRGWGAYVVAGALLVAGYYFGYAHSDVFVEKTAGAGGGNAMAASARTSLTTAFFSPAANSTELAALSEQFEWARRPLENTGVGIPEDFAEFRPNCGWPHEKGYPRKVAVAQIIENWNPDAADTLPQRFYQTVCRFDYLTELQTALKYRDAELPFQLYNVPEMNAISRKWGGDVDYLRRKLGKTTKYKSEASNPGGSVNFGANHFMYTSGRVAKGTEPPITNVRLSWDDWLRKVEEGKNKSVEAHDSRFYFRFSATSPSDSQAGWLFRELTFFQPTKKNIFFADPKGQRGIHCRFGMTGIIAEAHWDGSRNMIAQFHGRRRYILVDPDDSCGMYLLPKNHPSGRHSEVDWSKPDSWEAFPKFPTMQAHEVVQRPGDFLYLPTYYLHYIISLDKNYQCNTRCGRDDRQTEVVNDCTPGFENPNKHKKKKAK